MSGRKGDSLLDELVKANQTSNMERVIYYTNGLLVALVPIYLYVSIFNLPFLDYAPVFGVLSVIAAFLISSAYINVAESLKARLFAQLPEPVIPRETKKGEKVDVREALRNKQYGLCRTESLSFALLYNNVFYLLFVVLFAFVVFKNLAPLYNYVLSVGISAALVMVSSTSSSK
jgi:uncharacterized membrane protein (DUF485 family)